MVSDALFNMPFAKLYDCYVNKALRKNRNQEDVDTIICWLTGYDLTGLQRQIAKQHSVALFFDHAPALHPQHTEITGVVCGVRVEQVSDPLMRKIRYLDKLIDELAKGKTMPQILRQV
ncbi:hypothetical protein Q7C_980 [Methylophaga frappieri]|uniref:DUF2200 domain-containing protein n=1 Tax=Methylophaga frappieri (strain ATCC BAA-2434 / DSM 25690 / JAM7) TaxID=754477 RepID=I1YGV6_METFJ|nr:DUF2200 domain-containing protein [Methylophaga frappieri]AFJ02149.1 hypothetical protein Q7C_980 [Methylophaga frappieri]